MSILIRPAVAADVAPILEITNHAILCTTAIYDYDPRTLAFQQAWFDSRLNSGFPVFVAQVDHRVVGYGSYGMFRERQAYRTTAEHSVYVADGFSGRGIGGKLLVALIDHAKKSGIHSLVGGIDAANTDSIRFHEKYGFERAGLIREVAFKFDRWLDLVFMQKIL